MPRHAHFTAYLALAAVCFFWGTTYLGIRMALEWVHPFTLMSLRYLISGTAMLAAAFVSKAHVPGGRELTYTALYGVITIGVGTGSLAFAELWVPSGLAALFVTLSPFWMIGVEALIPGGDRLHGPTILGMLVGLMGTLLLVGPSAAQQGWNGPLLRGFLLLQFGSSGWALGSILQRRLRTKAHPVISAAIQQLATGIAFALLAIPFKKLPAAWSWRGAGAILYLAVFGGMVGYSAYVYVLNKLPVSVVSIYNYINPIVALGLGWVFYREHVGVREVGAMLIIFVGVAVVKRFGGGVPRPAEGRLQPGLAAPPSRLQQE
ncbi:MAG: EamA family transporter [Acidobacteriia bacterium]|nr:EamA family transporter [Terriglobia bacterium]